MNKSPLLILGLLLAGLSLWLLGSDGASVPAGLELGAEARNRDLPTASERLPQHLDVERQRESVARPLDKNRWAPEDFTITSDVRGDGSVMLEVRLDISEDISLGSLGFDRRAGVFPGIRVVMQTWDELADEIFEQEERTDSEGLARFVFPGAVHVDWVRGDLPPGHSGHVAYTWLHVDVAAGDHLRVSLPVAHGVHVLGRVVSPSGLPLAGVHVSAFPDNEVFRETLSSGEAWQPGAYETVSRHDGSFEFLALPDESATIGVAPGDWLQVNTDGPPHVRSDAPEGLEDHLALGMVRADTHFVKDLVIVRRAELSLLVLDADGQSAADVAISIWPEVLFDENLIGQDQWETRMNSALSLEDELLLRERHVWGAYEELVTDEAGRARFYGSRGSWRISLLAAGLDSSDEFELVLNLPQLEEQVVRLPWKPRQLRGRVVSAEDGRGVPKAKVEYWAPGTVGRTTTDQDGAFSFQPMVRVEAYRLEVTHPDYFAEEQQFLFEDESPVMTMGPSASLRLRVVGKPPKTLPSSKIRLLRRIGGSSDALPGGSHASTHEIRRRSLRHDGTVEFDHLQPGEYEVELWLFERSEDVDSWGRRGRREVRWARWALSTAASEQQLIVDLGALIDAGPPTWSTAFHGRVIDANTGRPIKGAVLTITFGKRDFRFDCDGDGAYRVVAPNMNLKCEVTAPGYEPKKLVLRIESGEQRVPLDTLGTKPLPLIHPGD